MNADSAYISRVHEVLKAFLRDRRSSSWIHHLTMARLVARALYVGRSTLIQTGSARAKYALSYLTSALLSEEPIILVTPEWVQEILLQELIPPLRAAIGSEKEILARDRVPQDFKGLILTTPQIWLSDRLTHQGNFPSSIPTLIDPADDLEEWARSLLTASLHAEDWNALMQHYPDRADAIRNTRVKLTKSIFSHPKNPYECHLIDATEASHLEQLLQTLLPPPPLAPRNGYAKYAQSLHEDLHPWLRFWHQWHCEGQLMWVDIAREQGQFTLNLAPINVAKTLQPIWEKQPIIFIGGFLDWETAAPVYRRQLGLGDVACLKFSPNRQSEHIQLYLPDRLPMPNTPEFKTVLMQQIRILATVSRPQGKPIAILIEDVPLKAQAGAMLAAEFGSLVQVEKTNLAKNGITIGGWDFWRSRQEQLPAPQLLIIATLPIPSMENPLVAGRVNYHKRKHQDWFHHYLLPTALRELQRAVVPVRESQGVVALLDNRVERRSYGGKILAALEPFARINYIDDSWFG